MNTRDRMKFIGGFILMWFVIGMICVSVEFVGVKYHCDSWPYYLKSPSRQQVVSTILFGPLNVAKSN